MMGRYRYAITEESNAKLRQGTDRPSPFRESARRDYNDRR
jgi:hypothetical protein